MSIACAYALTIGVIDKVHYMINGLIIPVIIAIALLVIANNKSRSSAKFWRLQAVNLSRSINDRLINEQTNKQNSR